MTKITIPSPAERDELLKTFARALFKNDMDMLYQVVASDFLWSFHDGLTITKPLAGSAAIRVALQAKIGGSGRTRTCGQTVARLKPLAGNHATPPR
jgi:hypothetical protein